jgi:hypothetical protein
MQGTACRAPTTDAIYRLWLPTTRPIGRPQRLGQFRPTAQQRKTTFDRPMIMDAAAAKFSLVATESTQAEDSDEG